MMSGLDSDGISNYSVPFIKQGSYIWKYCMMNMQSLMESLGIHQNMDEIVAYCRQHPLLTLFAVATTLSCVLPVVMFVLFAVLSIVFTLTAFLVIEGTILTIGSVVLCGCLLFMLMVMLSMTVGVAIAYFSFVHLFGLNEDRSEQIH